MLATDCRHLPLEVINSSTLMVVHADLAQLVRDIHSVPSAGDICVKAESTSTPWLKM